MQNKVKNSSTSSHRITSLISSVLICMVMAGPLAAFADNCGNDSAEGCKNVDYGSSCGPNGACYPIRSNGSTCECAVKEK